MDLECCGDAKKEAAVLRALGQLEETLDSSVDVTQRLAERLVSVLRPEPPATKTDQDEPSYGVPLADRIARIDKSCDIIFDNLKSVLDRLEI